MLRTGTRSKSYESLHSESTRNEIDGEGLLEMMDREAAVLTTLQLRASRKPKLMNVGMGGASEEVVSEGS